MKKRIVNLILVSAIFFVDSAMGQTLYTIRDKVPKYMIQNKSMVESGFIDRAGTKLENATRKQTFYYFESESDFFAIQERDLTTEVSNVNWKDLSIQISLMGVDVKNDEFAFGNQVESKDLKEVEFWDSFSGHLIDRIKVSVGSNFNETISLKVHLSIRLVYKQENGIIIELPEILLAEVDKEISDSSLIFESRDLQFVLPEKLKFYNWYLKKQEKSMPTYDVVFSAFVVSTDILEFDFKNNLVQKKFEFSAH